MPRYFYVFVRTDIPIEQQIIQTNHTVIEMTKKAIISNEEIPYQVLIGVPNKVWLDSVKKHLESLGIDFAEFLDNDFDFGEAAIVTVPLDECQRKSLRHYPLYRG